jgi:hypothetical protein
MGRLPITHAPLMWELGLGPIYPVRIRTISDLRV